ncbi:hypothetical protein FB451DRAFT_1460734 [Mycena latifolia]|nr:hypothetical protein FB451DRAFT_1460734 [Mycena latifolia]
MSPGWTQAPQGYQASDRGSQPQPNQGFYPPQTASQCYPGPGSPAPMTHPNRYPPQPQHFADGGHIPYNYGGTAAQPPPPQLAHPSSRLPNQQPGAPGYPSEYPRYFDNFGLNDASYPADRYPGIAFQVLQLYPWRSMLLWCDPMVNDCK